MTEDLNGETERYWEEFYRGRGDAWSGKPNSLLVGEVSHLTAGTALDLGSGEGGDAIWLASQGWQVTGVDVSASALARAGDHAAAAGVSEAIEWERHDLALSFSSGSFDLVSACYLHSRCSCHANGSCDRLLAPLGREARCWSSIGRSGAATS